VSGISESDVGYLSARNFECRKQIIAVRNPVKDAFIINAAPHLVFNELETMGYKLILSTSASGNCIIWTFQK